jgi:multiple sugar transport system permease protein
MATTKQRLRLKIQLNTILVYLFLILLTLFILIPMIWIVGQSFTPEEQIYKWPIRFIPTSPTTVHFQDLFIPRPGRLELPIARWLFNSFLVSIGATLVVVLVASLAAYAFARLEFPGRDTLFIVLGASMLIPVQLTFIPTFLIVRYLGWIDSYHALIWPPAAGFFGVFLLRQFFMTIPKEMEEAAIIDGCNRLGVYWHIILPLAVPALTTLAIFSFLTIWNDFYWPLIVLNSNEMRTLPVGLTILNGEYWSEQGLVMASAVLASAPVLLVYIFLQRHITKAVLLSGLGGR